MSSWFYADANNSRQGPVDGSDLARWLGEGRLHWGTLVWRDGMGDWRPMSDFADEFTALAAAPAPVAAAPDTTVSAGFTTGASTATPTPSAVVEGEASPFAASRSSTSADSPYAAPSAPLVHAAGVHQGGDVVYAGFWKRVAAYLIDGLIVGIATYAVQLPLLFLSFGSLDMSTPKPGMGVVVVMAYLLPLLMQMVYYAWFHASTYQATPGKMAIGIKVVDDRGGRISFLRGVGRYFSTIVSSLILCIGFVMAGFTERRQALHDLMCTTLVVDKWAYTANPEFQRRELGTITVVVLVLGGLTMLLAIAAVAVAIGMAARFAQ